MSGKMFWGSLAILAVALVNSGIEGTNSILVEDAKVRTLTERVGMEGVVTWVKERGVPMTPPFLIGYLVVLLLTPKAWALTTSTFGLAAPHGKKLVTSLTSGVKRMPGLVKAKPKTSIASAIGVTLLALTAVGYVYRDELGSKWKEFYSNHWVVASNDGDQGEDETSPVVRTRWDAASEWLTSDVANNHAATIFVVAAVIGLSLVSRKWRGKKEPSPALPEVLSLKQKVKELEAKVKEAPAVLSETESLPLHVRIDRLEGEKERLADLLDDLDTSITETNVFVGRTGEEVRRKAGELHKATDAHNRALVASNEAQRKLEVLRRKQMDFTQHADVIETKLEVLRQQTA